MTQIEGQKQAAMLGGHTLTRPSVTERLTIQRDALKEQLAQIEEALEVLNKNPEAAHVLDVVSRLDGRY